jgi:L-rhamnose mutarotase
MSVFRESEAEYERRHNPIWPELELGLREHGVKTYSIFLDAARHELFGYVEIDDEEAWQAFATTEICRRWWTHMSEIMPTNPDASPVSLPLREVFHMAHS